MIGFELQRLNNKLLQCGQPSVSTTSQAFGFDFNIIIIVVFVFRDRLEGPIDNFHKWFEVGVHNWLGLAKSKSIKRIKKAVELDEVLAMSISILLKHKTTFTLLRIIFIHIKK